MEDQELLTVQQVADILHVQPYRVRRFIKLDGLRAIRVGIGERGELRVARPDLDSWMTRKETKPQDLEPVA